MAEGLKPCPFCGGKAGIWAPTPRISRYREYIFCIVCQNCDLMFGYDEDYGGIFETDQEAIEAWNRRANDGETS